MREPDVPEPKPVPVPAPAPHGDAEQESPEEKYVDEEPEAQNDFA